MTWSLLNGGTVSFWRRNSNSGFRTTIPPENCLNLEKWQGLPHVNKVKEIVLSFWGEFAYSVYSVMETQRVLLRHEIISHRRSQISSPERHSAPLTEQNRHTHTHTLSLHHLRCDSINTLKTCLYEIPQSKYCTVPVFGQIIIFYLL